jgi:hypothetical protein
MEATKSITRTPFNAWRGASEHQTLPSTDAVSSSVRLAGASTEATHTAGAAAQASRLVLPVAPSAVCSNHAIIEINSATQ